MAKQQKSMKKVKEKRKMGRPQTLRGIVRVCLSIEKDQADWLWTQPGGASLAVRTLVDREMGKR